MSYIKNKQQYTQEQKHNIKSVMNNNILKQTKKSAKKEFDDFFFSFDNYNIVNLYNDEQKGGY